MSNAVRPARGGIIVQVTAKCRRWCVAAADRHAVHDLLPIGQQALLEGPRFGHLRFQPLQVQPMFLTAPAQLETSLHERPEDFAIERFLDEIKRRAADRPDQLFVEIVDAAGHQDDVQPRKSRFQLRHQLEAVQIGHPDVDNRQIRMKLAGHRQRITRQTRSDDVMVLAQYAVDSTKHAWFVVHDQNARRSHDPCACGCDAACGMSTWTCVPLPGSL